MKCRLLACAKPLHTDPQLCPSATPTCNHARTQPLLCGAECIKVLLENGADLDYRGKRFWPPIAEAISVGDRNTSTSHATATCTHAPCTLHRCSCTRGWYPAASLAASYRAWCAWHSLWLRALIQGLPPLCSRCRPRLLALTPVRVRGTYPCTHTRATLRWRWCNMGANLPMAPVLTLCGPCADRVLTVC